jgi:hypothetical protein
MARQHIEQRARQHWKIDEMLSDAVSIRQLSPLRYVNLRLPDGQTSDLSETISSFRFGTYGRSLSAAGQCSLCLKKFTPSNRTTMHPLLVCQHQTLVKMRSNLRDRANAYIGKLIRAQVGDEAADALIAEKRPPDTTFDHISALQLWTQWPFLAVVGDSDWNGFLLSSPSIPGSCARCWSPWNGGTRAPVSTHVEVPAAVYETKNA